MRLFLPSPDLAYNSCEYAWWSGGFSEEELNSICEIGEKLPTSSALVGANRGELNKNIRESLLTWIPADGWLAEKLQYIARQLNGQYFGLDLWGFGEDFQYTVYKYNKDTPGHYTWHMDKGSSTGAPRKLSIVLQLSNPEDYEGGELQLMTGSEALSVKKERGLLYAFPSYVMHRVTPVTRGTRRTLVVWISGPRFK